MEDCGDHSTSGSLFKQVENSHKILRNLEVNLANKYPTVEKNERMGGISGKKDDKKLNFNSSHEFIEYLPETKILQNGTQDKNYDEEMDIVEKHKHDGNSQKFKECLSKIEIRQKDHKIVENENTSEMNEQMDRMQEKKDDQEIDNENEKNNILPTEGPEFNEILSRIKIEKNEPILKTNIGKETIPLKIGKQRKKKLVSSNKNSISTENDHTELKTFINLGSRIKQEKDLFFDMKETVEKCVIPFDEKENSNNHEVEIVKETYGITIPLIGKATFHNNEKPLTGCYKLAIARNERRAATSKKQDEEIMRLIIEEERMSKSEKEEKTKRERQDTLNTARYLSKLCVNIMQEVKNGVRDEKKMHGYLRRFLYANLSPTCLLYVPHLIHAISFIRGNKKFSRTLRLAANECYNICHAMFPIPPGYNFETVYTSEMRKFLCDDFEKFLKKPLNYGSADDVLEFGDDDTTNSAYNSGHNSVL